MSGIKTLLFSLSLWPLLRLIMAAAQDNLGANPIEKIIHVTGFWSLTFMLIGLTASPLRQLTGWFWPQRVRRMLGLWAFFYASLHLASYVGLDQFFDWPAIYTDILKRPYLTIGLTAYLALIPLAITSNDALMRKMGGKNWRRLHTLVYPISLMGVIHFAWLVKKDLTEPMIFACLLTILLVFRRLPRALFRLSAPTNHIHLPLRFRR